jgi:hypothetical protein
MSYEYLTFFENRFVDKKCPRSILSQSCRAVCSVGPMVGLP